MENDPKKGVDAPADPGPVVSQAGPAAADATVPAVPTPEIPLPLSQVPATGWAQVNLTRRK
jgi:hypothetical protein